MGKFFVPYVIEEINKLSFSASQRNSVKVGSHLTFDNS
jgi:hypothetical protein